MKQTLSYTDDDDLPNAEDLDRKKPQEQNSRPDFVTKFTGLVTKSGHDRKEEFVRTQVLAQSSFTDAAAAWLESRKPYLGELYT